MQTESKIKAGERTHINFGEMVARIGAGIAGLTIVVMFFAGIVLMFRVAAQF